jgi:glycosyltransferase involved in cell wall biosynthesis
MKMQYCPLQRRMDSNTPRVAVLIPCYNESATIANVVEDFRLSLPKAEIYVYDNDSSDETSVLASQAGAYVRHESLKGKGNVVRRMFSDVEADIYVLVDGDGTYDAASAPDMVRMLLQNHLDMVTGKRVSIHQDAYRSGHRTGIILLTGIVARIFGNRVTDMLSGYRVFSRRFVKSFPALSSGFETETELTIHALELNLPVGEMETPYCERPAGSASKLRTYSDGLRILRTIVWLMKEERPLQFFSVISLVSFVLGCALSIPVFVEYSRTGLVPRFPTAILCMGMVLFSFTSLICGLILNSVALGRREVKRIAYLSIPLFAPTSLDKPLFAACRAESSALEVAPEEARWR